MSAQSWADFIMHNFSIRAELQFTRTYLVNAVSKSHISQSMDIPWAQVPLDHCAICCWTLQPKGKSKVYYLNATTSGNGPSLEEAWTKKISLGRIFNS